MADNAFDGKPMIVVVSDGLDPRTQRQLQAQLQADTYTVSQLETQIEAARVANAVKEELSKSTGNIDDIDTSDTEPEAIEGKQGAEVNQDNSEKKDDSSNSEEDVFSNDGDKSDDKSDETKKEEPANDDGGNEEDVFNNDKKDDSKPAESTESSKEDSKQDDKQANEEAVFESYLGAIKTGEFRFEDVYTGTETTISNVPTDIDIPPVKRLVVVTGTNAGVDQKTYSTVGTLEDPKNTVVVLDRTAVDEVDIKIQFDNLKDTLQKEGVMVVDNLNDGIDYLNTIYEQLPKK